MKIGFDLDRVFINNPPFIPSKLIDKIYKLKENGELVYRVPGKPEQLLRIGSHFWVFRPPITKNISFLKQLDHTHNKLYLISSRFGFLQFMTDIIMKRYQLWNCFDATYFNIANKQPHMFKNEVLKQLKLDKYVDDDLSLLKYVAHENQQTKLYWLNSTRSEKIGENLWAIKNLEEMT